MIVTNAIENKQSEKIELVSILRCKSKEIMFVLVDSSHDELNIENQSMG
jgi:hypothetical protein